MNITHNKDGQGLSINSDWEAQAKGLQEQYPLLSDADLQYEKGKESELLSRIETRLNMNRNAVIGLLQKDVIVAAPE